MAGLLETQRFREEAARRYRSTPAGPARVGQGLRDSIAIAGPLAQDAWSAVTAPAPEGFDPQPVVQNQRSMGAFTESLLGLSGANQKTPQGLLNGPVRDNPTGMGMVDKYAEGLLVPPESVPYTVPDEPATEKVKPSDTVKAAHEAAVEDQKTAAKEKSNQMAAEGRTQLAEAGASEEELKGWDKFVSEYDLGAMGAALLASNDGSTTFAANLGKALMTGRSVSERLRDKETAAEDAARAEDRDERELASEIQRREQQSAADAEANRLRGEQIQATLESAKSRDATTIQAAKIRAATGLDPVEPNIVDDVDVIKGTTAFLVDRGMDEETAAGYSVDLSSLAADLARDANVPYGTALEMAYKSKLKSPNNPNGWEVGRGFMGFGGRTINVP